MAFIAVAGDLDFSEDNTSHSCLPRAFRIDLYYNTIAGSANRVREQANGKD